MLLSNSSYIFIISVHGTINFPSALSFWQVMQASTISVVEFSKNMYNSVKKSVTDL